MKSISIDIETFSSESLQKSGVYRYAQSNDFEILLFGYSVDGSEVKVVDLARGEKIPDEIINALTDESVIKWAFNAQFERLCLSKWLGMPTGEYLSPNSWRCSMVWAATLGLPLSLAGVGAVLGLDKQKLSEGRSLIRYFCIPCSKTKTNGGRTRNLPEHDVEKWDQFKEYNIRDVETELEIQSKLSNFPVPETEWGHYHLDQLINDRGIELDVDFVNQAISCDEGIKEANMTRAKMLTSLENPNSPKQLKEWLASQGIETDSLAKDAVTQMLEKADGIVQEVLLVRQQLSKSSVSKYAAMENVVGKDHRARGLIQFYGANRTGRYSGRLIQVQNLPRNNMSDIKEARALVKSGNFAALEILYDNIPDVLSQLIRTAFVPKEGHRYVVADFSSIERVVLAWLAGEDWVLESYARKEDLYTATASKMFNVPIEEIDKKGPLRQKGKVADLACIAQGQLVLTDEGLLPIEKVTLNHKVWDGENFVEHDGVIDKGIQEVITYEGLTATEDHLVWIYGKQEPIRFGEAAFRGEHLVQTGNGRQAIRMGQNNKFGKKVECEKESLQGADPVCGVWADAMDYSRQPPKGENKGMPKMLAAKANTPLVRQKTNCCKTEVSKSQRCRLQKLWESGDRVQVQICTRSRTLDNRKLRIARQRFGDGPDRQRWALRKGEYSFCSKKYQSSQQENISNSRFQAGKLALFKKCCYPNDIEGYDEKRDSSISRIGCSRKEKKLAVNPSKTRVYDILNAGENHRFTVSNVLVHNCGYGGSVGALKAMGALDTGIMEEELQSLVSAWRASNPSIVRLWWNIDRAVKTAIKGRTTTQVKGLKISYQSGMLFIKLPSGRSLAYVKPRIGENRFGGESVNYEGIGGARKWERIESYGPKFVENIIQAISRDLLAEAMLTLENQGYEIVMHVHDEVVLEVPIGESSVEEVCELICKIPIWAEGLLLGADGFECEFYQKD